MKVGYNCRYLERPVWTGTEQYLFNLLLGLDGLEAGPFQCLFGLNKNILEQRLKLSPGRYQLETPTSAGWPGGEAGRFVWDLRGVGSMANRYEADVFHGTSFSLPFGLKMPSVVTFFDLAFLRHPGFYSLKENIFLRWVTRQAAQKARAVITISEFSKNEMVSLLGIEPQKIFAIPLGVSSCSQGQSVNPEGLMAKYGLNKPYQITVSTVTVRKNLEVLFRAMKIMGQKNSSRLQLCVVGRDGFGAAEIKKQCLRLGLGSSVVFTGPVPQDDLAFLTANACCALVPSRYEGFGLPVLEAMAAGVPVVAANASALPEVTGAAGLLADPGEPSDWADKMTLLLEDNGLAQKLKHSGRERAKAFTWHNTALKTYQIYEGIKS